MSLYIETIRLEDGELKNLRLHQERFEKTRYEKLCIRKHPRLEEIIRIPGGHEKGIYKCRLIYGKDIQSFEFIPYERKKIHCLKVVISNTITYHYKSTDRRELETLFRLREGCDDILIIRSGYITDSYYANVVFWDGENWFTPNEPLLPGTMRACLLERGIVRERKIGLRDIRAFQKLRLINAMSDLHEAPEIPVGKLK
jgi:4-amino-4-deoxychorismate lyase